MFFFRFFRSNFFVFLNILIVFFVEFVPVFDVFFVFVLEFVLECVDFFFQLFFAIF